MRPSDPSSRVVVTGGAGAIGSVLVRALLARRVEVRVIDNLSTGRREHLPTPPATGRLSLTVADLRDPSSFGEGFEGADAVWHLAANTDIRTGLANARADLEHGTIASFNVLEAARKYDVPRLFLASTSVVYGFAKVYPTPEEYGPLEPESLYGASKLAAEGLFSAYAHLYGHKAWIFRFANIIGPAMTHGVLYDFFEKLRRDPSRLEVLGDGRQSKSYVWTEDCVDGMLLVSEKTSEPVNLFNLGAEDRISARVIAEKVVAAHGGRARIEYTGGSRGWSGDVPQQLLATDKVRALGWRPRYATSAQAVDRTIEEMVKARGLARSPGRSQRRPADPATER